MLKMWKKMNSSNTMSFTGFRLDGIDNKLIIYVKQKWDPEKAKLTPTFKSLDGLTMTIQKDYWVGPSLC